MSHVVKETCWDVDLRLLNITGGRDTGSRLQRKKNSELEGDGEITTMTSWSVLRLLKERWMEGRRRRKRWRKRGRVLMCQAEILDKQLKKTFCELFNSFCVTLNCRRAFNEPTEGLAQSCDWISAFAWKPGFTIQKATHHHTLGWRCSLVSIYPPVLPSHWSPSGDLPHQHVELHVIQSTLLTDGILRCRVNVTHVNWGLSVPWLNHRFSFYLWVKRLTGAFLEKRKIEQFKMYNNIYNEKCIFL